MFKYTTAIKKLRGLTKRKRIVQGGTSAGKTFGILPILIDQAAKQSNLEISVVAESIPHLRRGAIKDFIKIMKWTNRWIPDNWNKSFLKRSKPFPHVGQTHFKRPGFLKGSLYGL